MIKTTLAAILPFLMIGSSVPNEVVSKIDTTLVNRDTPIETPAEAVVEIEVEKYTGWTCEGCTIQEQMALKAFHDQGITDKYAIAALMGNIKQESLFIPDICEGGARVAYEHCHTGGYGLIQWTTTSRYDGLGRHARNIGKNPSTTEAQLSYLFTEYQWKRVEPYMKTPGKSIEWYMKHAYTWLGWGIHGERTDYAYNYARELYKAS
tara:strand:+ start:205 stop:825 length:621 start_codon:yes stop_codon:yes gene_type:complete